MPKVFSYAAKSATDKLEPLVIQRRDVGQDDIQIKILYCGICHSDIHMTRDEWGFSSIYPMVPGHEIIGTVTNVGAGVTGYKVGDLVGVGCLVDSCQMCTSCVDGLEQYCEQGSIGTYGAKDTKHDNSITYGGYSEQIVVDKKFVLRIPTNIDAKKVAPLLCAGITTWSPIRHWGVGKGDTVGIIGLGGLGHMGIKFAHAMGCKVVMITTSEHKGKDAKELGADEVLISTNANMMQQYANKFDFLLNTIPVQHDVSKYVELLKRDATMVVLGSLAPLLGVHGTPLILGRKRIAGSVIGGIKETQEMLDFCGEHEIVADVEMINIQDINEAYSRMIKSDVKYRFVIDMASLKV
ncbi:MAG: NAD(P)-dependent alcohol dehydrogenase [Burkholderiales bacterium]|nr:NAD(P)-dependent alcohol dehydrogenase [Burkholderiales bacterium]